MKYDPLKLFSRDIKTQLREQFPDCQFSVRTIMHNSVDISLVKSPIKIEFSNNYKWEKRKCQLVHQNPRLRYNMLKDNPLMLNLWEKVSDIISSLYAQTNYTNDHWCSYNYYLYFHIGRWGKPYVCTRSENEIIDKNTGT